MLNRKKALLALEDGTVFEGVSFGAEGEVFGEVVFTTSMTGYQEIVTDPSFKGQIVTMTCPLIGNVGANSEDVESERPQAEGFIVKEISEIYSNWRAEFSFEEYLSKHGVVGISEIDTRALVKKLRDAGTMRGVISTVDLNPESLVEKALSGPKMEGLNLVDKVSCKEPYEWNKGTWVLGKGYLERSDFKYSVAVLDFGIRKNILRNLVDAGIKPVVLPAKTPPEEILKYNPDGVFLSCGPGDPAAVDYAIETIKYLIATFNKPIFGICLGHQLTALALGGKTYKLKFGHRGANQPVLNKKTGKVEITAQNHGFAVSEETIPDELEITHISLNDKTVEGLKHKTKPIFTVQYHPESSPGPHDSRYLFREFAKLIADYRGF
ncbi:glutamine-hydrolyzing carbamoyl-phosphate synthase small subunit [Desulfurobacterium atlanticum]|uniref:Carbamoyl phosphate synthase small chain n=1 Tax=Desulfurobacterium atlanticum TaxID=240169 RepID=A0A238XRS4_9BACT|nr:glutamine-hydrolyzing carbamoyl-phosphate synthase small subunit [Desulfurobacterium atlanticum]SNR61392.1 carbamoyl-phosphate synthase small subunit [Desulfurobacterium atlanticum]